MISRGIIKKSNKIFSLFYRFLRKILPVLHNKQKKE